MVIRADRDRSKRDRDDIQPWGPRALYPMQTEAVEVNKTIKVNRRPLQGR
jgi:hypothetical protein